MKKPNCLFIGGSRVGSKWCHRIFQQYPTVFVPDIPDPFFFDRDEVYQKGIDWYFGLFKSAPDDKAVLIEFSHDYCYSKIAAKRIKEHLPDVKMILCIRNPIDRAYSHYNFLRMTGKTTLEFKDCLNENPVLIDHSRYAEGLSAYYALFPREQIKIFLYDELGRNPIRYVQDICDFLGIPFIEDIDYQTRFNVSSEGKSIWIARLTGFIADTLRKIGMVNLLGKLKQQKCLFDLFYQPVKKDIPLDVKKHLLNIFEDDIAELERLTSIDLSHWRL